MEIKLSVVRDVCFRENDPDELVPHEEWKFIDSKIIGNDSEDGGAEYEAIIQNTKTGQFYRANYNDWDFHWEYADWNEDDEVEESPTQGRTIDNGQVIEIYQVWPKVVTKTIYTNKE